MKILPFSHIFPLVGGKKYDLFLINGFFGHYKEQVVSRMTFNELSYFYAQEKMLFFYKNILVLPEGALKLEEWGQNMCFSCNQSAYFTSKYITAQKNNF